MLWLQQIAPTVLVTTTFDPVTNLESMSSMKSQRVRQSINDKREEERERRRTKRSRNGVKKRKEAKHFLNYVRFYYRPGSISSLHHLFAALIQ